MKDVLEEIVAHKRQEVELYKRYMSLAQMAAIVEKDLDSRGEDAVASMRKALMDSPTGIIAEFKRKSPSKGWINQEAKPTIVPVGYQEHGAAALSILTDTQYFGGYDEYISMARLSGVTIPVLYKNFVIDEYQLFQACHCGASAVLLIAACLTKDECGRLMHIAHQMGMEVLLEMHNDRDFEYAALEPDMYGVNNRNLGSFVTDVNNSFRLAERLPQGECLVSESGISHPDTVKALREVGFRGFLIGENFMKSEDPGACLGEFIRALS